METKSIGENGQEKIQDRILHLENIEIRNQLQEILSMVRESIASKEVVFIDSKFEEQEKKILNTAKEHSLGDDSISNIRNIIQSILQLQHADALVHAPFTEHIQHFAKYIHDRFLPLREKLPDFPQFVESEADFFTVVDADFDKIVEKSSLIEDIFFADEERFLQAIATIFKCEYIPPQIPIARADKQEPTVLRNADSNLPPDTENTEELTLPADSPPLQVLSLQQQAAADQPPIDTTDGISLLEEEELQPSPYQNFKKSATENNKTMLIQEITDFIKFIDKEKGRDFLIEALNTIGAVSQKFIDNKLRYTLSIQELQKIKSKLLTIKVEIVVETDDSDSTEGITETYNTFDEKKDEEKRRELIQKIQNTFTTLRNKEIFDYDLSNSEQSILDYILQNGTAPNSLDEIESLFHKLQSSLPKKILPENEQNHNTLDQSARYELADTIYDKYILALKSLEPNLIITPLKRNEDIQKLIKAQEQLLLILARFKPGNTADLQEFKEQIEKLLHSSNIEDIGVNNIFTPRPSQKKSAHRQNS